MQKSVLVAVDRMVKHKKYDRIIKRTSKLMVRRQAAAAQPGTCRGRVC